MRTLVAAAVACVTLASLSQAGDAQAAVRKSTNIPAQALEPALQSFAQDRQLYIIYAQQDVITHRTAGATGELTRDETLKRLLGGTGLTYQYLDDKTVTVLPIATAPAATSSPNLPSGESAKPTDKAPLGVSEAKSWWQRLRLAQAETSSQSSIAQSSSFDASAKPSEDENVLFEIVVTAQKREERLQDVPISIAVLSGNSLDEPTVQGVSEALSRVPGVISAMSARAGGNTTQVVIRGVGPQSAGSSTPSSPKPTAKTQ